MSVEIDFGRNAHTGAPVVWHSSGAVNAHMAVFGDTGMGKTHTLRKIVAAMQASGHPRLRFHVFDAHGDVEIPGESAVVFHESADFGFNPLELNPDPEFGGVRKRIQSLIGAINRTSVRLGPRQERALTKLLTGLYKREGFVSDDASTWAADPQRGKQYPTLPDAIDYGRERLKAFHIGSDQRAVRLLDEVNRLARQLRARTAALGRGNDDDTTKLERDLETAKAKAIDAYRDAVLSIQSGEELDDSLDMDGQKETLESVVDRLENLYQIGIYRSTPPPLDPRARVWRYIIKSLSKDEKKLFTLTRLETIFTRAVQRGEQRNVVDCIVIDEAHLYQDKEDDYIVNRMAREARKFGVAMLFASQSPTDFADVLLSSLGTKVILGLDPNFWPAAVRKLGLTESQLKSIVPHRRILVQMKGIGQLGSATNLVAV
ncbi:ATP-binding protein [Cupriavidus gilardii]|nr:ATP-binding protein [Cupriavidus gilardii]